MLVSSTLNPSYRSSVQLLVIHYNDERVLVPVDLHPKYSDLQEFITKEWALEDRRFFIETDGLDICSGKRVRIHAEAWLGIKDIVGNVYVRVRRSDNTKLSQRTNASVKGELKHEEDLTPRAPSESADEAEVEQQTKPHIDKGDYMESTPTARSRGQDLDQDGTSNEDSLKSPRKQKPEGDTLNLFGDEVDAGERIENDVRKEDGSGETALENTTTQKPTWKTLLGSLQRTNPPNSASSMSSGLTLGTPTPAARSTGLPKANNGSAHSSGDNAGSGDPDRVLIVVEPPSDSIYEARGFRIRREHSVRTVLKGASKAFKIDYTKARLRMLTEEDEAGEFVAVKCDDSDTMTSLNVADNQRFVIEMTDGSDEVEESD